MKLFYLLFEKPKFSWLSLLFESKLNDIRSKLSGKNLDLFNQVLAFKPEISSKY